MHLYLVKSIRKTSKHSYMFGIWSNLNNARQTALKHAQYHGGKYNTIICVVNLNCDIDSDWNVTIVESI